MRRIVFFLSFMVLILNLLNSTILAEGVGIEGYVKDAKTGEPLIGANIMLIGTNMGIATNMHGRFVIANVPPGTYTIRASYIGYKTQKIEIRVKEDVNIKQDFNLEPVGIEGKTITVTAQASGQSQAINQQLSADQIVNVVSAAKIQELPDANAAESVGRLPGINVLRSGGEGNQVVIRGLAPKYNEIMIDGIKMSSSDPYNRSTDLSMISSNMLDGIQVSKTVTPDMDADVLGGVVNFELRQAKVKEPGVMQFGLLVQGGYNNLANAYNKYNNYKYICSVENRFLEDQLGVFAQIDVERKNLTSNEFGASYDHLGNNTSDYSTTGLNLYDIPRDRQRYNGAVVIDYKLPEGKIKLTNFVSSGSTNIQNRGETFGIVSNTHYYRLASSSSMLNTITNGINFQNQLPIFEIDAKLSHTYSETKNPDDWAVSFVQTSVGLNKFIKVANLNPQNIPKAANNDFSQTLLQTIERNNSFARERTLTASIDLKTNLNLSDLINAEIKFGGKYRYQTRSYMFEQFNGQSATGGSAQFIDSLIASHFGFTFDPRVGIPITHFIDPRFDYGKFLGGNYTMIAPLNFAMLSEMVDLVHSNMQNIANNHGAIVYARNNYSSTTNNYSGNENLSAFYIMSKINIGSEITIIPGVRYQNLQTTYTAARGMQSTESFYSYNHYDTTVTHSNGYWLPDVSLRYKPFSWFDIRLSYTNTLAYPDFNAIIPRIDVGLNQIIWLNHNLLPSRSTNYDAYFSFYDNTFGLFTVGTFLKQIQNLIYPWSFYVTGTNALKYLPSQLTSSYSPVGTYIVYTFVNDSYKINDYGLELDWQTHFWYLPEPLSGLVLSVNYTHIFSKAQYPFTFTKVTGRSVIYVDSSFTDRLLYQPDNIINLSLGYDYKDFSIRVSMLYQDDIFTGPNFWPQLRSHTSSSTRWDLAIKQELPWFGLQLYGDINNINGANDVSVIQGRNVPISEQDYGLTADLGLRWKF
ncbi:MAG: TonB-dependent receptor [Ignavibacteriales bacterium]|nr:TonB-dependent receptor [Ignavibacteriales bacterium]